MKSTLSKQNEISLKERLLVTMASQKLTKREKKTLSFLFHRSENKNATQTVKDLKDFLDCAESTAWNVLRSLRSLKLVDYDSINSTLTVSDEVKLFIREKIC